MFGQATGHVDLRLAGVDDRGVATESVRLAYRRALAADRAAITMHEEAAVVHARAGHAERAAAERAMALLERDRLRVAELAHPDWV